MISSELNAHEESDFKRVNTSKPVAARLSFKPLPLSVFQKEIEEARNEPLPSFNISDSESETDDTERDMDFQSETHEEDEEVKHGAFKLHNSSDSLPSIPEENIVESRQIPFVKLPNHTDKFRDAPMVTPAKVTHGKFLTPSINRTCSLRTPVTLTRTPKSSEPPKIQYSISTESYLNTPLTKMSMLKQTPKPNFVYKSANTQKPVVTRAGALQERYLENNYENEETAEVSAVQEKNLENKCVKIPNGIDYKIISVKGVGYLVLSQLGTGGSSVVYNCFDPATKNMRAIKRVNLVGDRTLVTGYINEVKLLEKLQKCDRIIRLFSYEIIESEKALLMVLEKGDADLSKILKDLSSKSDRLPAFKLIYYWMEMLYAVKEIHDNDVIHSDLKPANFLQISSGLKLIDFGIASCIQSDMTSVIKNVPVGSFNYISPEALSSDNSGTSSPKYKVSFKSDVWSLGCILYQLVYRKTPFQHIGHHFAKMMAIVDPKQQIKYPEAEGVPSFIINTIKSCLQHDMKSRPSVRDLIDQMEETFRFK